MGIFGIAFLLGFVFCSASSDYYFHFGSKMIPHNDKVDRGGEDAFYASEDLLVVADGVGGWAKHGIDPGFFSRKLVSLVSEKHRENPLCDKKQAIYEACDEAEKLHQGSSTALVLEFVENTNKIRATNLGDCGYILMKMVD